MATNLLLIDNDTSLCKTLQAILTKKDFHVEIAHSAMTGLRKAYACDPDAVILDLMLPDMDGWQLCSRLREMSDVATPWRAPPLAKSLQTLSIPLTYP